MLSAMERETFALQIMDELRRWPGVETRPHPSSHEPGETDGIEFRLYGRQIGHVHLDCSVHLSLTKALKERVLEERLAEHLPLASGSGWTMFNPMSARDSDQAIWLLRLNYVRLRRQRLTPEVAAANELLQRHQMALAMLSSRVAAEVQRTRARSQPRPLPAFEVSPAPQLAI